MPKKSIIGRKSKPNSNSFVPVRQGNSILPVATIDLHNIPAAAIVTNDLGVSRGSMRLRSRKSSMGSIASSSLGDNNSTNLV